MPDSGKQAMHSIRLNITATTVLFTLLLSISFSGISFFFFRGYARTKVLRAAEFNLKLVSHLIQQDLIELNSMANRQALDAELVKYLTARKGSRKDSLNLYDKINEMVNRSRSYSYIQRFLVTDGVQKILQVSSSAANAVPLTLYTLPRLPYLNETNKTVWQHVFHDPLLPSESPDSLLILQPVLRPGSEERIGSVWLSASVRLITDRLSGYETLQNSRIYLLAGNGFWLIDGTHLRKADLPNGLSLPPATPDGKISAVIQETEMPNGEKDTVVSCRLGGFNLCLTHTLPPSALFAQQSLLWGMIAFTVSLVLLMGLALFLYLDRLIVRPINKLRGRIGQIAGGDFSADPSIEWTNELGEVGRGVNQLSRDVHELMSKRLADEKERQSLEYKMLQHQMNPHFIYNTLNSIKWMASLQGVNDIADMTTSFARLLKNVSKGNRPLHRLREEFALLYDYCTIQQYRYGGAITIEIAELSDVELCNCMIPSLSLQPLAENAIFHGIEPKGGVGSILLHIRREENGDVLIAMQDDGVGMTPETVQSLLLDSSSDRKEFRHVGVRNVHQRIRYAFGEPYGLSVFSELGVGTRIEIRIPFCRHAPETPASAPRPNNANQKSKSQNLRKEEKYEEDSDCG